MKPTILFVILTLLLKPVLPVAGYVINYDYIVKELCENKEKPQLHCNGKCQLMKEMAKASENEKPLSQKKSQVTESEILFCQEIPLLSSGMALQMTYKEQVSGYNNLYTFLPYLSYYHPPTLI